MQESKYIREFNDKSLLIEALTHKSYAYENPKETGGKFNERLELLGDSVFTCLITDYLYERFQDSEEGELSTLRAKIACRATLANFAMQLGLDNDLRLGIGALGSNMRSSEKVLEDTFEAYVGALFLDMKRNYVEIKKLLDPFLDQKVDELVKNVDNKSETNDDNNNNLVGPTKDESVSKNLPHEDPTNRLQTWSQRRGLGLPTYKEINFESAKHGPSAFTFEVFINNESFGVGKGANKRSAKRDAAINALKKIFPLENNVDDNNNNETESNDN